MKTTNEPRPLTDQQKLTFAFGLLTEIALKAERGQALADGPSVPYITLRLIRDIAKVGANTIMPDELRARL